MTYITTFTGVHFDLEEPTPEMVHIGDIAHHLAYQCRWVGATHVFWSIAQHSVLVAAIVPDHLKRWALMHDAAEAYIGDITRPLKTLLPGVREIESRIMHVIAEKFSLALPEPSELAEYDDQIQRLEGEMFMPQHDRRFISREGHHDELHALTINQERRLSRDILTPVTPMGAEIMFLLRFQEIFDKSVL